jgi:hypothetical protein
MHSMRFASRRYIDAYGAPKNRCRMVKHRPVMQVAYPIVAKETFESRFSSFSYRGLLPIKTNVRSANRFVASDGIEILSTYACALKKEILASEIELRRPPIPRDSRGLGVNSPSRRAQAVYKGMPLPHLFGGLPD